MDLAKLYDCRYPARSWPEAFLKRLEKIDEEEFELLPCDVAIHGLELYLLDGNDQMYSVIEKHKGWIGKQRLGWWAKDGTVNGRKAVCFFRKLTLEDKCGGIPSEVRKPRRFGCGHARSARETYCAVCFNLYKRRITY
jgi:hypothetical protein